MINGYSRTQIRLHWLIFALIALQYLLHELIAGAWDKIEQGLPVDFDPLILAHVAGGGLVFTFALWRIALRLTRGAPPLPSSEPAPLRMAAHLTHLGLYALMLLMPVSGAVAWFGGSMQAGDAHEVMRLLLLALIALHVVGALYQQFVLKTDIMARMKRPE